MRTCMISGSYVLLWIIRDITKGSGNVEPDEDEENDDVILWFRL